MAVAALPRWRASREQVARRRRTTWASRTFAVVLLAAILVPVPSSLLLGEVLTASARTTAVNVQGALLDAIANGVDPAAVQPLEDRLSGLTPLATWEDPVRAAQQLQHLGELERELTGVTARETAAAHARFAASERRWNDLAAQAAAAGLSLEGLDGPVTRLQAIAGTSRTPSAWSGAASVVASHADALEQRLTAYTAVRSATLALLAEARSGLRGAAQYPELKLGAFQNALDDAARAIAAAHLPETFQSIQNRIRQTEADVQNLLGARQAAYAELAAARSALASAQAAGIGVSAYVIAVDRLNAQLAVAGDAPAFRSIATQLAQQRQAIAALLVVTIPAPIYHQAMNLDCETSALRMALAAFGSYYTDAQLFAAELVDLRPPVMGPNHTIAQWGNPYTAFVGNVNGSESIPTGYGVYYPVIVALARSHGVPGAVGGEGYAPATIYAELWAHHPVEVWVEYDWASYSRGVWTAWDGTRVRYSYGEHAVTLTGVSPTEVCVNDPGHGSQYWISKAAFEASWSHLGNMAVIFR